MEVGRLIDHVSGEPVVDQAHPRKAKPFAAVLHDEHAIRTAGNDLKVGMIANDRIHVRSLVGQLH
jgi:hypothetical protein